jgi:tetratricopeptide (TPR) repeat protein
MIHSLIGGCELSQRMVVATTPRAGGATPRGTGAGASTGLADADEQFSRGEYKKALEICSSIISACGPQQASSGGGSNMHRAESAYTSVLPLLALRAKCCVRLARWEDALRDIDQAARMEPGKGQHWAARGVVLWRMQRHALAFSDLQKARDLGVNGVEDLLSMLRAATPNAEARDERGNTPTSEMASARSRGVALGSNGALSPCSDDGSMRSAEQPTQRGLQLAKLASARRKLQHISEGWSVVADEPRLRGQFSGLNGIEDALVADNPAEAQRLVESLVAALAMERSRGDIAQLPISGVRSATKRLLHLRTMILHECRRLKTIETVKKAAAEYELPTHKSALKTCASKLAPS